MPGKQSDMFKIKSGNTHIKNDERDYKYKQFNCTQTPNNYTIFHSKEANLYST